MVFASVLWLAGLMALLASVTARAAGNTLTDPTQRLAAYLVANVCYWTCIGLGFLGVVVAVLHNLHVIDGGGF